MAISVSLNGENFEQVLYTKEDAFEQLVAQNAQTIFGDKAIYIDAKKKVNTSSLGGTVPDGFLIDLSDPDDPQFYLVEIELQSHDFFKHIFPQITKFFAFYRDSKQRHKLIETMFSFFQDGSVLTKKLRDLIGSKEVYKFLKDTIDSNQNILIIIDGPKPEFEEIINTYTDTWGKMVAVQVISHFQYKGHSIIISEPPFQNIEFSDAITQAATEKTDSTSNYTEEFHLKDRNENVIEIYNKLKQCFLKMKGTLIFNPTKYYISVRDNKNIAFVEFRRKKVRLTVLLPENEVRKTLCSQHHKVIVLSESVQRVWGGDKPNCHVEICDTKHFEEIESLLQKIVAKNEEL
jgi:predicted transport protein